jgi:predicted nucleotidyltransferase
MTMKAANEKSEAQLNDAVDVARRFASQVKARFGEQIRAVRLFGSAARGDWTPESDVDILVVIERPSDDNVDGISRLAFHLGPVETGVLLRPLAMDRLRFEALGRRERRIALDIEREGIDL